MKTILFVSLILVFAVHPVFAQPLSDATGLVTKFDVKTAGKVYKIETVANFNIENFEFNADQKRLTLFIVSGLQNNLGEVLIPQTLLNGNFTFYLNGESYSPTVKSSNEITFITLKFPGTGNNKLDIISTGYLTGENKTDPVPIPQVVTPEGGGCLIATATYGSELAPQVQQLRELRDNKLLQTKSGTSFMNAFNDIYYTFSPAIADYERENPLFKEVVKVSLTPMITSLAILNHVDMTTEESVMGYGASLIILNLGMYIVAPMMVFRKLFHWT